MELIHNDQYTRHFFAQLTILFNLINVTLLEQIRTNLLFTFQSEQDVISKFTFTFNSNDFKSRKLKISVNLEFDASFEVYKIN